MLFDSWLTVSGPKAEMDAYLSHLKVVDYPQSQEGFAIVWNGDRDHFIDVWHVKREDVLKLEEGTLFLSCNGQVPTVFVEEASEMYPLLDFEVAVVIEHETRQIWKVQGGRAEMIEEVVMNLQTGDIDRLEIRGVRQDRVAIEQYKITKMRDRAARPDPFAGNNGDACVDETSEGAVEEKYSSAGSRHMATRGDSNPDLR